MTLVSETKNAVIFGELKSGACYFFGKRKMSSAGHPCPNKWKLQESPCIMCVQYIGGCSVHRGVWIPWVHRGDIMSTSGNVQYIRGIPWVHRGCSVHRRDTMSTSGGYHDTCGGYHKYMGVFSTSGGYHEYIGGISWVHRGDIMSTSGDVQYIGVFNRNWKDFIKLLPHMYHDIPPMYWTSPDVLMISPWCAHGIPPMYWTSPDVLMVSPHVHHDIPPMYWTSPDVLMISPRCTHDILQMYSWYPPDVLNTHYTGWEWTPTNQNSRCKNLHMQSDIN